MSILFKLCLLSGGTAASSVARRDKGFTGYFTGTAKRGSWHKPRSSVPGTLLHAVKSVHLLHSLFSVQHSPIKTFLILPRYSLKARVEKEHLLSSLYPSRLLLSSSLSTGRGLSYFFPYILLPLLQDLCLSFKACPLPQRDNKPQATDFLSSRVPPKTVRAGKHLRPC